MTREDAAKSRALEELVDLPRLAYSGELAAAHAYRGHWRSVADPETRTRILRIEEDEWRHRALVGEMLATLGRRSQRRRELRALVVGRTLGLLCHVSGWLLPMYGAGRLERRNIVEYETAARLAASSGHPEFIDCLLTMAEVEWDHEQYFRTRVLSHRWAGSLRLWPMPPPREEIRASFSSEVPNAPQPLAIGTEAFACDERGA